MNLAATHDVATAPRIDVSSAAAPSLLRRGEPGYEAARRASVWSPLVPDRYPDAIARPADVAEVIALVRHARASGTPIAVRGGGHNYVASFLRDGGLMIDMAAFDMMRLEGDVAYVGPAVRSAPLAAFLEANGRAFPTGHSAEVRLGGFLLGGGMGWNGEHQGGFACFRVRAIDIVTADGEQVTASADSHPDLFWAARGAGPAFPAVATGFRLETRPMPAGLHRVSSAYPLSDWPAVGRWLEAVGGRGTPDLEVILALGWEGETGKARIPTARAILISYDDDPARARAALGAAMAAAPAGARQAGEARPAGYAMLYANSITGTAMRIGNDTAWTDRGIEALGILARRIADAPTGDAIALVNFRNPPRLPADAPMPAASVFVSYAAQWTDPADDDANLRWVDQLTRELEPLTLGCYVNETDWMHRPERARLCFTPAAWERLKAVHARYDPAGLFPPAFPLT